MSEKQLLAFNNNYPVGDAVDPKKCTHLNKI